MMGFPLRFTSSTDNAYKGSAKIRSIVATVAASQTWTLAVFDATGHTGTPILNVSGVAGATTTPLTLVFEGLELKTALSFTLTQITDITFELS